MCLPPACANPSRHAKPSFFLRFLGDLQFKDKTILANINKSIDASVELRSKKALIEGFVAQMTIKTGVDKDWKEFVKNNKS